MRQVVLVADYSQLSEEDKVEIADACGDVRDTVRELHNQAIGMARAIERPNQMLSRKRITEYARACEKALLKLQPALTRLPLACVMVACLALSGCSAVGCGDAGEANRNGADKAFLMASERVQDGQGVGGCTKDGCPAAK